MVVVNTHLYGAHLASGGAVLPPHQVVVFDEAHEVEEVMTDSLGVDIGPGRFRALAASARPLVDPGWPGATDAVDGLGDMGDILHRVLSPLSGRRVPHRSVRTSDGAGREDHGRTRVPVARPRPGARTARLRPRAGRSRR